MRRKPRTSRGDVLSRVPTGLADGFGLKELPYLLSENSPQEIGSPASVMEFGHSIQLFGRPFGHPLQLKNTTQHVFSQVSSLKSAGLVRRVTK
jgi:hypothetical protein